MTTQSRVIENHIKDRITFVKTTEETNGEYLLLKEEVAPHGGTPMHYHVSFTEKFEVLEGQLNIMIAGEHKILKAGQGTFVPLKAHHRVFNTSETPVAYMTEVRPARQFEKALRVDYGLARDGKTNAEAIPTNLWHLALLFQLSESYLPGVPLRIQQGISGVLASIAKRLKKDKEFEKYL